MQDFEKNTRKDANIRRANKVIQTRGLVLMLVLGIGVFIPLLFKLYSLQITRHDELESKAVSQQTKSASLTASRGTIYDTNGNILAISTSAETIFLSPKEINEALLDPEKRVTWTKQLICSTLGSILSVDEEVISKKLERLDSQYEVIKLRADEELAEQVSAFKKEYSIPGIYLIAESKRYYPYANLAAQVVGFVGDENTGLYGLEAEYESILEGKSGLVVTAKDNAGNDMTYEFEQYFNAQNGSNVITTIDTNVQYYLEEGIQNMISKFSPANGATGIVMNAKTGAIMAMASYPNFDLNDFTTVTDEYLLAAVEDETSTYAQAQLKQWRNKSINDTYEPGSTFKILTLSACLEEGIINENTMLDCNGAIVVGDSIIYCSNTAGHGYQTLKQTVGNSCNPAFITYGLNLGRTKFYEYMRSFGLMSPTGIDISGEAIGVFADPSSFTTLDLACYAFGQNFTVTPVGLISAQAACVNGGYLRTPYLVDKIVDSDGNVTYQHDTTPIRQVISSETSAKVRECLQYVVDSGTGKNGQVAGYKVGGKTGTADKGQTGDVVVSFLCFAPADDPEVIMLITMDTPSRYTGTFVSGGNMVAPTSSKVFSEILPYLGYEATYSADDLVGADATVPNIIDLPVEQAIATLDDRGFTYKLVGDGDIVTDQTPIGGSIIPSKSAVIIYAGAEKSTEPCTVPDLLGKTPSDATSTTINSGLLIRFTGTTNAESNSIRVIGQTEVPGTQLNPGSVITVQLGDNTVTD